MLVRHMSPQLKNESTVVGEAKNTFTKQVEGHVTPMYKQTGTPPYHLLHLMPTCCS